MIVDASLFESIPLLQYPPIHSFQEVNTSTPAIIITKSFEEKQGFQDEASSDDEGQRQDAVLNPLFEHISFDSLNIVIIVICDKVFNTTQTLTIRDCNSLKSIQIGSHSFKIASLYILNCNQLESILLGAESFANCSFCHLSSNRGVISYPKIYRT